MDTFAVSLEFGLKMVKCNGTSVSMWYRLSRREDDFCIECPEDSSFEAKFTNMEITDCKWLAHDGQQPDEKTDL